MNAALTTRNLYEEFEVAKDILFFKVGSHGLISFHGRNYHIRKRLPADQQAKLMNDSNFFRVSSNCYINIRKVSTIENDCVYFGSRASGAKYAPISKRKQQLLLGVLPKQLAQ